MKYEKSVPLSSLRQGELLSNVIETIVDLSTVATDSPDYLEKEHPFAFVMSQDCDLDWDFSARLTDSSLGKILPNVLFCEVRSAPDQAQIIVDSDNARSSDRSRSWSRIKINKDERYHFFEMIRQGDDLQEKEIGELVIDFKRYFTVPTDELYARIRSGCTLRRCCLLSPYLEHLSSRFAYFQSRVALPEDHQSEPGIVRRSEST